MWNVNYCNCKNTNHDDLPHARCIHNRAANHKRCGCRHDTEQIPKTMPLMKKQKKETGMQSKKIYAMKIVKDFWREEERKGEKLRERMINDKHNARTRTNKIDTDFSAFSSTTRTVAGGRCSWGNGSYPSCSRLQLPSEFPNFFSSTTKLRLDLRTTTLHSGPW